MPQPEKSAESGGSDGPPLDIPFESQTPKSPESHKEADVAMPQDKQEKGANAEESPKAAADIGESKEQPDQATASGPGKLGTAQQDGSLPAEGQVGSLSRSSWPSSLWPLLSSRK